MLVYKKNYIFAYLLIYLKVIYNFYCVLNLNKNIYYYYFCVIFNKLPLYIKKNSKFEIFFFNCYVFMYIELISKSKRFVRYNHFLDVSRAKIISYRNFTLNVDLVTSILFREYVEVFRVKKYNEYLKKHWAIHGLSFNHKTFFKPEPPYTEYWGEFISNSNLYYIYSYRYNLFFRKSNIFYYKYDSFFLFEKFDYTLSIKLNWNLNDVYIMHLDFLYFKNKLTSFFKFFKFYEINIFYIYLYQMHVSTFLFYKFDKYFDYDDIKDFLYIDYTMARSFLGVLYYLDKLVRSKVKFLFHNNISRMSFYFNHLLFFLKSQFHM